MAVTTFREFGHHACGMGSTMAVLALGDRLMHCLMAERTGECLMLGAASREQREGIRVARAAVFGRDVSCIGHSLRHVCLVAFLAIRNSHIGRVGFVALHACRYLSVNVMTGGAVERSMFALLVPELGDLLGMAGQTWVGDIARKRNVERGMRILVAAQAVFEFIMGFAHMAHVALGNVVLYRRPVASVAPKASNGFVFPPIGHHVSGRHSVTLDTVIVGQGRAGRCLGQSQAYCAQKNRDSENQK